MKKTLIALLCLGLAHISYADDQNPYDGTQLFVNPDFVAEVKNFFDKNPTEYKEKAKQLKLVDDNYNWLISTGIWLDSMEAITGYNQENRKSSSMLTLLKAAADKADSKPVTITFVVYDLPLRDCDAYSSNGEFKSAADLDKYENNYIGDPGSTIDPDATPTTIVDTLKQFYNGSVKNADNVRIVFIVEPDSLPNMITNKDNGNCATAYQNNTYFQGISYTLKTLGQFQKAHPVFMYLDIAHSGWMGWTDNINQFASIYNSGKLGDGFDKIRGFISNTANYTPSSEAFSYDDYLKNTAIISSPFYSWNNVYDEHGYIAEVMAIDKNNNNQIHADGSHRISAASSPLYSGMHFLIDTSRNGWITNSSDYKAQGTNYPRKDQRHHRGNWCNIEAVNPTATSYEDGRTVPTNATSAGLGDLPTSSTPSVKNPLYNTNTDLPLDAYVWIKPPLESDGFYSGSAGDQMCGSKTGGSHNGDQSTDSLQDGNNPAPHAGSPFDQAFKQLIDTAIKKTK